MIDDTVVRKVLQTWADDAAAFADALVGQDPSWRSRHFPLGGGRAVLCGAGMYVNRAFAAGLDAAIPKEDWLEFERQCGVVGVSPMFEVSPLTSDAARAQLVQRRYQPDDTTSALFRELRGLDRPAAPETSIRIESVVPNRLRLWQETSAEGWGHTTPEAVAVSNAFAAAAAVVDGGCMLIAMDRELGHPLGCASMTVRNGIATLGGMSTLPAERGRGVQATLITHRLHLAKAMGCDLATTTAGPNGTSERNLVRHGFERCFLLENHRRDHHLDRASARTGQWHSPASAWQWADGGRSMAGL